MERHFADRSICKASNPVVNILRLCSYISMTWTYNLLPTVIPNNGGSAPSYPAPRIFKDIGRESQFQKLLRPCSIARYPVPHIFKDIGREPCLETLGQQGSSLISSAHGTSCSATHFNQFPDQNLVIQIERRAVAISSTTFELWIACDGPANHRFEGTHCAVAWTISPTLSSGPHAINLQPTSLGNPVKSQMERLLRREHISVPVEQQSLL
jgi:hypothetical protein